MKRFYILLLILLSCATANAQTFRTLSYNATNGQITALTNVIWTNAFKVSSTNVAASIRQNIGLGNTGTVKFQSVEASYFDAPWVFVGGTNGLLQFETGGRVEYGYEQLSFRETANGDTVMTFSYDLNPVYLNPAYWNHASVRSSLGLGSGLTTNQTILNGVGDPITLHFTNGILTTIE